MTVVPVDEPESPRRRFSRVGLLVVALLVLLAGGGGAAWWWWGGLAGDPLKPVEEHFRRAEYNQVIDEVNVVLQKNNKLGRAFALRGGAYNRRGDFERALADCEEAIRLSQDRKKDLALAYAVRGDIYGNLGDTDRAIRDCDKAIELDPTLALAYAARSDALGDSSELDRAIADADKAIELDPKFGLAHAYRGAHLARKNKDAEAMQAFDKAIELSPKEADVWNSRGVAQSHFGRDALALADYTKAVELAPDFAEYYSNRASVYLGMGKSDEALKDIREALDRSRSRAAPAHEVQGEYFLKQNNPAQAISSFDAAIRVNQHYASAYVSKARVLFIHQGQTDAALATLEEILRLHPKNATALLWRGLIRMRGRQDYDGAAADFTEVIHLAPHVVWALSLRGEVRCRKRDFDGACADCQAAIDRDKDNAAAHAQLAWCHAARLLYSHGPDDFTVQDCDQVMELSEKALKLDGKQVVALRAQVFGTVFKLLKTRGADFKLDNGNPEDARLLLQMAGALANVLKADADDPYMWLLSSWLNARNGKEAEAKSALEKALKGEPALRKTFLNRLEL
jgi:tetratricopeptide (TPR) repeat protein